MRQSVRFVACFASALSLLLAPAVAAERWPPDRVPDEAAARLLADTIFVIEVGREEFEKYIKQVVVRVEDRGSYWHLYYTWDECSDTPPPPKPGDEGFAICTGSSTDHVEIVKKDGRIKAFYQGR